MKNTILLASLAFLTLATSARAAVMYTVYDNSSRAQIDVSFSLPALASSTAASPTNLSGMYSSAFNTTLVFTFTNFGGTNGQIGPASEANPPFGIFNDLIQLSGQQTSPGIGTYGSVLLRVNGSAVTRAGVLVVSDVAAATVPEPGSALLLGAGLTFLGAVLGFRAGRRDRA